MMRPLSFNIALIITAVLLGCTDRDCTQLDSAIIRSKILRIEVINDEEGTTNIVAVTPDLLGQFSTANRVLVSNYKKRYAPGYIILSGGGENVALHYYGNRLFGTKNCLFEIKTTNAITAYFKERTGSTIKN